MHRESGGAGGSRGLAGAACTPPLPLLPLRSGTICLDILKDKWSAAYSVATVLLSLQSLLGEPNNDSPLNPQAAGQWVADLVEFRRIAVRRYREATGTNPSSGWGAAGEA